MPELNQIKTLMKPSHVSSERGEPSLYDDNDIRLNSMASWFNKQEQIEKYSNLSPREIVDTLRSPIQKKENKPSPYHKKEKSSSNIIVLFKNSQLQASEN